MHLEDPRTPPGKKKCPGQTDRQTRMADQVKATFWGPCTLNNPTDEDRAALQSPPEFVKAVRGQDEVGENGTPHIQFMVQCKTQQRMTALKRWLPRAHFEAARNVAAVKNYVSKSETSVEGSRFEVAGTDAEYVTPAKFPRWLAKQFLERFVSSTDIALPQDAPHEWAAEWTVRTLTREGIDILFLWAQASLRKVTIAYWPQLLGVDDDESLAEFVERARRYAKVEGG